MKKTTCYQFFKSSFVLLFFLVGFAVQSQVTVTGAVSGNGTYASLRLAFNAINGAAQTSANINLSITADTNEGVNSAALNAGVWTSLTIKPVGNRIISGNTTAGNALVNLNGADNVVINGLNTSGNSLIIKNTTASATTNTSTIRFIADATSNTITNCTITGSETTANGGIIFFSTGTTTGNDSNTISNCAITSEGSNLAMNGIYSAGSSVAIDNSGNTVSGNTIYDIFNAATAHASILIASNSAAWSITNNKIYQTTSRTATGAITIYGIRINTASAGGYTISGNTIGYASSSATGTMTYVDTAALIYRGIDLTSNTTTSSIQGNTVTAISITTLASTTTGSGIFAGINVGSGAVNVGTTTGNIIGTTTSSNAITVTSTSAVTTASRIAGIYVASASATSTIQNNTVAGISTGGSATNGYSIIGIYTSGASGIFTTSYNTIGSSSVTDSISAGISATTTTGVCNIYGIYNDATGAQTITNNSVLRCRIYGSAGSFFYGIQNNGGAGQAIVIDYNTIDSVTLTGTNTFRPIINSVGASTLSISNNTLRNFSVQNAAVVFTGIMNSSSVTSSITMDSNKLGDATGGLVTFTVAMTGAFIGITNSSGSATATLSIQNNDIRGVIYSVSSTNTNNFISNAFGTLTQNISNNTFTNLSIASSGNVTFISDSVALPSSGTQTISGNSIVTGFAKTVAGGTVTVFTSTGASNSTATIVNSSNNFSNITVTGATTIAGWVQNDSGGCVKTIASNTFSNWTGGTNAITVISASGFGRDSGINGNTFSNITGQSTVYGISLGTAGTTTSVSIYSNTISSLSSTGTGNTVYGILSNNNSTVVPIYSNTITTLSSTAVSGTVAGIYVYGGSGTHNVYSNTVNAVTESGTSSPIIAGILINGGTTVNVYKNKVYDLSNTGASTGGFVAGISFTNGTTCSAYNNLIADLKSPLVNIASAAIRGINVSSTLVSSTYSLYFNTVYLNASSAGTNFGTCALYHAGNATSTTASLLLKNNIFINISTPSGTGNTVAYLRSSTATQNFDTSSNYNLYYAGTAGVNRLIFFDGTNSRQTLASYQNAFTPIDFAANTENVTFLSTSGSSSNFLKPDVTVFSSVESGGVNISGLTDDYLGTTRQGNSGYAGTGSAPDLGAFEQEGTQPTSAIFVTGAVLGNGNYLTLGSAFAAINAGTQTSANIVILVRADTDEGNTSASLNAGTWSSLTIKPASGSRLITGATTAGSPLVNLNGADNVIIDGLNISGKSLTFQNTTASATANTSTIRFIADASNNTLTNLTIAGSETSASSGVVFLSTGTTTGNDTNTISNCIIKAAGSNLPANGIYSAGSSTAIDNSGVTVSSNNIQDCFNPTVSSGGIIVGSNSAAWTISGNRIFQTATRTVTTAALTMYGIRIATASGGGYTISNNTIGFANANGTGTTSFDGAVTSTYKGIELQGNATVSSIQGNTVAGISFNTVNTTASGAGVFAGIAVLTGTTANIGNITGNTVGSSSVASSISVISTATTLTRVIGIYISSSDTCAVQNNTVGGFSTGGALDRGYNVIGIYTSGTGGNFTVSSNYIGSPTVAHSMSAGALGLTTTGVCTFYGIFNDATGNQLITSNTISNCSAFGTAGSIYTGIINSGGASNKTLAFDSNTLINGYSSGTGTYRPIQSTGIASTLSMSSNTIRNHIVDNASAIFIAITNTAAVVNSIAISSNILGDNTAGLVTFNVANSGAANAINNSGGASTSSLTISNNTIKGWVYSAASTAAPVFITNTAATLSQDISSNVFNGLSINTTGNVTLLSDSVILSATGSQTVSYNSISGSFAKTGAGGTVTVFTTAATSLSGASIINTNNNFSNISVTGATTLTGWIQADLGPVYKLITNNTFSNWTGGTSAVTVMNLNGFGSTSSVSSNTISSITGQGAVTGLTIGSTGAASTLTMDSNSISSLSSTGTGGAVTAIANSNNSTIVNISNSTISTLSSTGASTTVAGIQVSGGTGTANVSGNNISSLSSSGATSPLVIGAYITGGTTVNVFGNTINTFTSTGTTSPLVSGVHSTINATVSVYKNKIYDLNQTVTNSGGVTYGISFTDGTTVRVYNNLIGDLRATVANIASAAIRGISVNSTRVTSSYGLYHNTINLNATSSGTNFGTAGVFHTASATATTANLILRNNLIINTSTANGTGVTAAYQRSSTATGNYDATSNNNLFYGGVPSATKLIYFDGTNKTQTISALRTLVSRESVSQTENTSTLFQNTAGANANFLRLAAGTTSFAESAAVLISSPSIADDYWGITRPFSSPTNYGTAPDIGASEFDGFINCTTPTTQPTSFVAGSTDGTTAPGSFTAASGTPNGYLVVRSVGALSGTPTDATLYVAGNTFGSGTVIQLSASTSFTATGLSPNTTYTFTIFSYNNAVSCGGGPKFNTTSPLTGTMTTCSIPPTGSASQGFCGGTTVASLSATGTSIKWYSVASAGTQLSTSTALVDGSTYYATQTISSCESRTRLAVTVSIGAGSIGGTTASTQTICQGNQPSTLTLSGQNGSVVKWQRATDAGFTSPTDISSTSTSLTGVVTGALSTSTYFRAVVQDGGCTSTNSSSVLVTVTPTPVGGTLASNQTICAGNQPASLILGGSSGSVLKWQSASDAGFSSPSDISSTSTTLTGAIIGNLSSTKYFRAVLQNGSCPAVNSTSVLISVDQAPVGGSITADQTICSGSQPANLTLTGYTGTISKWQSATAAGFSSPTDIANTSTSLTGLSIGNLSATRYYRAEIQNGVCPVAYATYATISVVTTTWNGTAWNNGNPDATKTIAFSGNYTSTADLSGCAMNVSNNATVIIGSGFDVTLDGALTVDSGSTFTLGNNANLMQNTNAANSGTINVQRNSSSLFRLDYTIWSSPVASSQSLLNFSPLTQSSPSRFYTYNSATAQFNVVSSPSTTPFNTATGYLIRMPNTTNPFSLGISEVWTGTFTGVPNNGNYSRTNLFDGGSSTYRYNAVGNPYPSALNMSSFIAANSSAITGTLWFWRKTNDVSNQTSYSTCTSVGCTLNNGISYTDQTLISIGQGFLVEVLAGQNTISFTNSMRRSANVNQFFKQNTSNRYWLDVTDASKANLDQFMAVYTEDASLGYDAGKDGVSIKDKSNALVSESAQHELTIDARPEFEVTDVINMSFNAAKAGVYQLQLAKTEGVFEQQDIFVHDLYTKSYFNLKDGAYSFLSEAGANKARFELMYQKPANASANADSKIWIFNQHQQLGVQSSSSAIQTIEIFDLRGSKIFSQSDVNATATTVDLQATANQVLLVTITLKNGEQTTQKVMN